eukprot:g30439.t1
MKDEMAKWDSQRKIYEAAVDESLEAMRHKLDSQRFALEQKESTLHHLNRNLDRVASEVNRLLEDQDAVREVCESRVDEQSKRLTLFKAESEVRFARMERQHNALSDELWGDELGLAKVAGELKKTNATFGKLEDLPEQNADIAASNARKRKLKLCSWRSLEQMSQRWLKALKKRLGGVFDNSDAVLRGIEHIYSVTGRLRNVVQTKTDRVVLDPVLESELMQCALEKQDAIDRDRISLMGVKDDELTLARSTHTEPQRPRPECRLQSAPGGLKPNKTSKQKPVVRVDNRCVSCSGQAPLVLAAFKMACLHYAPVT